MSVSIQRRDTAFLLPPHVLAKDGLPNFKAFKPSKCEMCSCCGDVPLFRHQWELSLHHRDSVMSRTTGTVDVLSRPSVLRFATHCCICLVVIWSPNSIPSPVCSRPGTQPVLHWTFVEESGPADFCQITQTVSRKTLHRFPAALSWTCFRR